MSAIEPRIIAFYTGDPVLTRIMQDGLDFHGVAAQAFFGFDCHPNEIKEKYPKERKLAKELDLLLFYGGGVKRIQISSTKHGFNWTRAECQEKYENFKDMFKGVFDFRDNQLNPILSNGGPVYNLLGRPVLIEDPSDVWLKGLNTLVQSTASDLVVNSAYKAQRRFEERRLDAHVLLLVHDEIVVEVKDGPDTHEAEKILIECMTDYALDTDLGPIKLAVEGKIANAWEK